MPDGHSLKLGGTVGNLFGTILLARYGKTSTIGGIGTNVGRDNPGVASGDK